MQLLLRCGANVAQSNLRGKTPVDVAATDVIARLLREEGHLHHGHHQMSAASSDDSDESSTSPATAATSPSSVGGCLSPRLTPGSDSSEYDATAAAFCLM